MEKRGRIEERGQARIEIRHKKERDQWFKVNVWSILMETKRHPLLRKLQPMAVTHKPNNATKYCEFHEQRNDTTTECIQLKRLSMNLRTMVS